jgi:peptidoglycan/xylan/chitin deacetylase (PgdA/CDA1 family)
MRRVTPFAYALLFAVIASPAVAGECANPNALGTSRTLVIDNTSHPRLGAQQYGETLPLADREVVLTFDDGPLGPYTTRILDILASECVKATYFLVGTMAKNAPELVHRIQREGHTIGTHSLNHPLTMDRMPLASAEREIDGGIAAVTAVLGDKGQLAPFFRIPGLLRSGPVESYLQSRSLVTWSVDLVADDWHRHITANDIQQRALRRIENRGRGILLLHDIHPATALALPGILKGLKAGGYRIVHVVPASASRPKTITGPQMWAAYSGRHSRVAVAQEAGSVNPRLPVPSRESLGADYAAGVKSIIAFTPKPEVQHVLAAAGDGMRLPPGIWPHEDRTIVTVDFAPSAPGAGVVDWPRNDRVAPLQSSGAAWPVVARPAARAAEPSRKTTASRKHVRPAATACRSSELNTANLGSRCKKPVGHQLSLTPRSPAG